MKINRRNFILKLVLGLAGLVVFDAFWFEKYIIDWNDFDISTHPENRLKVIQLSDLHLRPNKTFHRSMANRINLEKPDVLLLTGDAIERPNHLSTLDYFLNLMDHDILKIAILGNKEHSGKIDLQLLGKVYENHNGILLVNESHVLDLKNRKINILGVDDYVHGAPDFAKSVEGIDTSLETIVLNHCPVYREEIERLIPELKVNVNLILSGHTHGGQVTFFGRPFFTPYGSGKYVKGWYENETSKMYVSKGIGTTSLPIRFWARAEATIFYV